VCRSQHFPTPARTHAHLLRLDLHLGQTVLPDSHIGRDTVLAVVEEDDHAIGVHGLADEELVVLEVGDDLLGEGRTVSVLVLPLTAEAPEVCV
jgi:hypothetical protein